MRTFCDPKVRKQVWLGSSQDFLEGNRVPGNIKHAYIEVALDFDIPVTRANLNMVKNSIDRAIYDQGPNTSVSTRISEMVTDKDDIIQGDPW